MPNRRDRPADFEQYAYEPSPVIRARYTCGASTLSRWRRELGIDAKTLADAREPKTWLVRPIPDDFVERQAGVNTRDLAKAYGASTTTIRKWLKLSGIKRERYQPAVPRASAPSKPKTFFRAPKVTVINHRDDSLAGQASRFMQADAWISYRCTETGKQNPKGTHYRLGRLVVTPEELIERAERKGFRSWSIAA